MSSSDVIEPPRFIATKKEGLSLIANVCVGLQEGMKNDNRPLVGLVYLKFKTEEEMDEWIATFRTITNHFWRHKMNRPDDLHFISCARENARTTVDVIFADTQENVKFAAETRFPGMKF
jgi:hypothetical protein